MANTTPTPVTDKNGKQTTVHRRTAPPVVNGRAFIGAPPRPVLNPNDSFDSKNYAAHYVDPETYTTDKGINYNVESRPGFVGADQFTVHVDGREPETVQMHENGYFMSRGERMGKTLDEVANNIAWV